MKKRHKLFEYLDQHNWAAYTFAICSGVFLFLLITKIKSVLALFTSIYSIFSSIILGLVMAYILNPLMKIVENGLKRINPDKNWRKLAVVLTILIVFVFMFILMLILIPSLYDSFSSLFANINSYISSADSFIENIERMVSRLGIDISEIGDSLSQMLRDALNSLPSYVGKFISTSYHFGTGMINALIGFILAIYFLLGKEDIIKAVNNFRRTIYSENVYEIRTSFWHRCNNILTRYVWCTLLDGFAVGLVNAILMMLFRLPYVPLVSMVVAVTNMLPTFGPLIGAAIGGFILVTISPLQALIFIIITLALQTVDGYIVKPRLFGNSLGVPAVMILIAIVVGGKMFGVVGILLAIPISAIITILYKEALLPRLVQIREANETH